MVVQRHCYITGRIGICHQTPDIDARNAACFQPVLTGGFCRRDINIRRRIEHRTAIFIPHQAAGPDVLAGIFYGQRTVYMAVINDCAAAAFLAIFRACLANQCANRHFILRIDIHLNIRQIDIAYNRIRAKHREQTNDFFICSRCICLLLGSHRHAFNRITVTVKGSIERGAIVADGIPIRTGNINICTQRHITAGVIIFIYRFCKFSQLLGSRNDIRMRLCAVAGGKEGQIDFISLRFFQGGVDSAQNTFTAVRCAGNRVQIGALRFNNFIHQDSRFVPIGLRIGMGNDINLCDRVALNGHCQRNQAIISLCRAFIGAIFIRTLSNIDRK